MPGKLKQTLGESPIFSSLPDADCEAVLKCAFSRVYPDGSHITNNGDIWPYLFLVLEGGVEAVKESSEGRSLVVTSFQAGDLFWGLAFFYPEMPIPVTLQADGKVTLCLWAREDILPILLRNGFSSWELCRLMIQRMQRASTILEELAFQPVTGRVARLLLDQFPADKDSVSRHLTLDEMAARVGTTREMVCRILYRFAEEGAIQINRTEFIFTDRKILKGHVK